MSEWEKKKRGNHSCSFLFVFLPKTYDNVEVFTKRHSYALWGSQGQGQDQWRRLPEINSPNNVCHTANRDLWKKIWNIPESYKKDYPWGHFPEINILRRFINYYILSSWSFHLCIQQILTVHALWVKTQWKALGVQSRTGQTHFCHHSWQADRWHMWAC